MTLKYNLFLALGLLLAATPAVLAQDVDLGSQRSEKQDVFHVPGQKIDHNGLVINPTPHSLEISGEGTLYVGEGINYPSGAKYEPYREDLRHLRIPVSPKGPRLNISVGAKDAAKQGVEAKSGAYKLVVGKKGINVTAFDDAGAFYALQTLLQIYESFKDGYIPYLTVTDYPDLPYRGVVEGFYGTPWSHDVRLSLIEFYGRHKMNNYIYGPKDDPYHSSPNWRQPYPENEARQIKELVDACKRNRVNFVWAIHPGQDIRWNKEDYDSLVNKLDMMYGLGVRSFAIFFDDISGIGTDSNKQSELINDLTRDFVKTKGDVTNLMICPTDYTEAWANPTENGQLAIYGQKLNPDVEVFWTGSAVCSDLTPSTLEFVNSRIKRPALYWWNFPVSDYCRNYILQGPSYGLDTSLTSAQVAGIESNPMEHGEASKLALYGVADYSWNVGAYNPIDNWERGLVELVPEAADAYRTFAIHSADTETGYRRAESWETEIFPIDSYTPAQFDALRAEFENISKVPAAMEAGCANKGLLTELRPWLVEFGKLGERGVRTLDLIKVYESGNDSLFWNAYVANLMSEADKAAYTAHKSGTMKLQPFYENAMSDMLSGYYKRAANSQPAMYKGVGTYKNLRTNLDRLMLDNDTATFYTSATSQRKGDWIGIDLKAKVPVYEVVIRQGRNSVNDVDYFERAILEASVDGKSWVALTDSLEKVYDINWTGEPVEARYVRLRRLDSEKRNWASVRIFNVNPPSRERLGFEITSPAGDAALFAFDNNPLTSFVSDGLLSFGRPEGASSLLLLMKSGDKPATIVQTDGNGKEVSRTAAASSYATVSLVPEATAISIEGPVEIFEVLSR